MYGGLHNLVYPPLHHCHQVQLVVPCDCFYNNLAHYPQDAALVETKKELHARPTEKLVDDLRKKVKILQVSFCDLSPMNCAFQMLFCFCYQLYPCKQLGSVIGLTENFL